jgi:hypothetical protein
MGTPHRSRTRTGVNVELAENSPARSYANPAVRFARCFLEEPGNFAFLIHVASHMNCLRTAAAAAGATRLIAAARSAFVRPPAARGVEPAEIERSACAVVARSGAHVLAPAAATVAAVRRGRVVPAARQRRHRHDEAERERAGRLPGITVGTERRSAKDAGGLAGVDVASARMTSDQRHFHGRSGAKNDHFVNDVEAVRSPHGASRDS